MNEAERTAPEEVADRQLAAYNAQDVEAFVACYDADVEAFELPSTDRTLSGRSEMRERYSRLFARHPKQRCRILQRTVEGRFVIDHEEITGRDGGTVRAVALYEVQGDRIRRVWFLR
jgi:hypothetical protein